jgi:hypothetical protein
MTRDELIVLVTHEFDFLVNFGFSRLPLQDKQALVIVRYVASDFGIDVEIEMLDFFIYVLIACPAAAEKAGYYDSGPTILRRHLQEVLRGSSRLSSAEEDRIRAFGGRAEGATPLARALGELLRVNLPWLRMNLASICGERSQSQ